MGEIRISIPSENLGFPLVCKKRFSAIFASADKSFLACPAGKCIPGWEMLSYTRECKAILVHDVRTSIVTL